MLMIMIFKSLNNDSDSKNDNAWKKSYKSTQLYFQKDNSLNVKPNVGHTL